MAKRILSISYDRSLLWTRHLFLQEAGFDVVSALGASEAQRIWQLEGGSFSLVLLGHSIPRADSRKLIEYIRERHDVPILALLRPYEAPVPGASRSIESIEANVVLATVQEMLSSG